jgi:hypothetical protein
MDKQLRSLSITDEHVKISFVEADYFAGSSDNEEEDNDKISEHHFSVKSGITPHKDLTDSMKKLRRLALDALEINLADAKDYYQWDVTGINIAGNYTEKKSRLVISLAKNVKSTGKAFALKTGQITMYPDAEDKVKFPFADKITPIVEDIIEECWSYLNGKYEEEGQYVLFPDKELVK